MALTRIQKISGQAFVNGVSGTKLVGFGVLGRVSTLSYYIDPNQINGFTYDAVKKSWWSETPENTGALPYAADPVTSAELDRLKKIYEQHNELEGFSASDPVPEEDPFFTPSLWKNLVEGVYAGAPVLMGKLKEAFNTASNTVSPIILDLDGDGIETVGVNDGIHFDHDGNGFSELTGWVSQDDALLVYDKNNNNSIDDGGELFGNNYSSDGVFASNGFQALADFDSNNDGVVNALDENFSKLKVWKDFSMDGVVNDGELLSLAQVGVVSLDLDFKNSDYVDGNGNQHRQLGDFLKSDGTAGSMADVWFKQDKTDTEVHQYVAIDEEISKLPDLVGFGNVYDLHEAMARDLSGALKLLVENFAAENDASKRKEIANEIIFKWTGADQYAIGSRGGYVSDARKIYAVEAFTGEFFIQGSGTNEGLRDPGPAAAAELDNAFTLVSEYYYSLLLLQTHYAKYTSQALVTFLDGDYKVDSLGVVSSLNRDYLNGEISTTDITTYFDSLKALGIYGQKVLESLRAEGNAFSGEFGELLTSAGFALVSGTAQADNLYALSSDNSFLSGLDGDDHLFGGSGDDILHGDSGSDTLESGAGSNQLFGGEGNDLLKASSGSKNNLLVGGFGDDQIYGAYLADTYLFNLGDGRDTITEYGSSYGEFDTLSFGAGILASDIRIIRVGLDLVFIHRNGTDQVTVKDWFDGTSSSANVTQDKVIEHIEFADGTSWSWADISSAGLSQVGTDGAETLTGWSGNDIIHGGGGNDTLVGGAGANQLYGDAGDDTLVVATGSKDNL
ncbi:calcium-binding protein, partial [Pseudomonas nunensis]|uniref:calcium-binding protein n=1 Tax=Pseudomonas nunensis TaxID=2961896 RepID=UPI0025B2707C